MRIWDDTRPPSYLIHESTSDDVFGTDRVESAEAMPEFEADFMISAQRRNLPRDYVDIRAFIAANEAQLKTKD